MKNLAVSHTKKKAFFDSSEEFVCVLFWYVMLIAKYFNERIYICIKRDAFLYFWTIVVTIIILTFQIIKFQVSW